MYKQVSFYTTDEAVKDMLIALLSEEGFEGFEEQADRIIAFIPHDTPDEAILSGIAETYQLKYDTQTIEKQNWNESWEQNFHPVVVEDFCTVRAAFHKLDVDTPYEIIITPKMSFGTGHHATTFLMMQKMRKLDFASKTVLDFGTGTGILAILAGMLGAAEVQAVDNEEWAYLNAKENSDNNNCSMVHLWQGSLEDVPQKSYDIILANINRHILLQYMNALANLLVAGGTILLSGILREDENIITAAAIENGLNKTSVNEMKNWLVIELKK